MSEERDERVNDIHPHACMTFSFTDAKVRPVVSWIGSASISARSIMVFLFSFSSLWDKARERVRE